MLAKVAPKGSRLAQVATCMLLADMPCRSDTATDTVQFLYLMSRLWLVTMLIYLWLSYNC